MKRFVAILTCLAVAYHLLAGCCGHHAHAQSPPAAAAKPAAPQSKCCGHQHHHEPQSPASSDEHAPADSHDGPCDEVNCSVTLTAKVHAPQDLAVAALDIALSPDLHLGLATSHAGFGRLTCATPPFGQGRYLTLGRLLN